MCRSHAQFSLLTNESIVSPHFLLWFIFHQSSSTLWCGECDYGRFGSYFVYDLEPSGRPLEVNYRFWLQEGEMTIPQVASKSADFVEPVAVTVK